MPKYIKQNLKITIILALKSENVANNKVRFEINIFFYPAKSCVHPPSPLQFNKGRWAKKYPPTFSAIKPPPKTIFTQITGYYWAIFNFIG